MQKLALRRPDLGRLASDESWLAETYTVCGPQPGLPATSYHATSLVTGLPSVDGPGGSIDAT
jgi:hypothetical protein